MMILKIYTDGACSGNQNDNNIGGWGCVLEYGEHQKELFGGQADTTNNRMEMTALIEALSAVKKQNQTIEVFSDSSYLMNCFREKWYEGWLKNNWITSGKKPVENRDLWENLLALVDGHNISFYRVKGHVNLNSKTTNFDALYEKFIQMNGNQFSFEDFKYITQMNNKADALANKGINMIRDAL
ncbi:ribonuclease H family protein [Aminipila terrae]|uniref:ribonuclease H n=1 Tax=Aminipila terrae TaxID=2697030 RepID=A0A6P1MEN0_9FIRM|nr:ribonuclease H [Aminipila terrae]QHI72281.1 ribonuclease HI [Aminipila terrae]